MILGFPLIDIDIDRYLHLRYDNDIDIYIIYII